MNQMNNYYQQQVVPVPQAAPVVDEPVVSVTPEPTYPNGNTTEEELSPPEPERPARPVTPEPQNEPEPVSAAPEPEPTQPGKEAQLLDVLVKV